MGLMQSFKKPGSTHVSPASFVSNQISYSAIPPQQSLPKPKHWTVELMPFSGDYVPCFVSRAEHETAVIGLCTGMNSSPLDWPDEIAKFSAAGISVVAIGLHQTADFRAYYAVNKLLLKQFFFDEACSPLYKISDKNLPRIATLHSTASPIFADNLTAPFALERKPTTLSGAIYLNPFWDTYTSSKRHYPVRSAVHGAFMLSQGTNPIGRSRIEAPFANRARNAAKENQPKSFQPPENARVRHTRKRIRELGEEILDGKRQDTSLFPQKMYLGTHDRCVCNPTARDIAAAMAIDSQSFDADHYNMLGDLDAMHDITTRIRRQAKLSPKDLETRDSIYQTGGVSCDDDLSRLRLALQC